MKKTVLSIASLELTGRVGILADLKVFQDFKILGEAVISANTVQLKSFSISPVPINLFKKQLSLAINHAKIIKIGVIYKAEHFKAILSLRPQLDKIPIVVDPILWSSRGHRLIQVKAISLLKQLIGMAYLVTPNLSEAEVLSGMEVKTKAHMIKAAQKIYDLGPQYVLIKGGHLKGDALDVLYDGREIKEFKTRRILNVHDKRGTGCRLSSSIAASLAKGYSIHKSITQAKKYVERYLRTK